MKFGVVQGEESSLEQGDKAEKAKEEQTKNEEGKTETEEEPK